MADTTDTATLHEWPVVVSYPKSRVSDMSLNAERRMCLKRIVAEFRQSGKRTPTRKLLLTGLHGTGKSFTCRALAGELGIPMVVIDIGYLVGLSVVDAKRRLTKIFESISLLRGVIVFEDALGRSAIVDEVVDYFLQLLQADNSHGLIICTATGKPTVVARNTFDIVLGYGMPTAKEVEHILRCRLAFCDTSGLDFEKTASVAHNLSHAEIAQVCRIFSNDEDLGCNRKLVQDELIAAIRLATDRVAN